MSRKWAGALLLAGMWAFALAVFGRLPAEVPVHFELSGKPDDWMPRFPGAFLLPAVSTGVWLLVLFQGRLDPRAADVERSTSTRMLIVEIVLVFMAFMEVATLGLALGWPVDMGRVVWPAVGALLVLVGNHLPRVRPNWFVGVRTPWTLSSDAVWRATHRVAGWAFVAAGVAFAGAALLPERSRPWVAGISLALAAGVPTVYSYLHWKRSTTR